MNIDSVENENRKPRFKLKKKYIPYVVVGSILAVSIPTTIGILFAVNSTSPISSNLEIDAQGTVYYIVDGDTFDMSSVGRVRLADIDCPDQGEPGCQEARDFLDALINGKHIYLDIDDIYQTDIYGRTVGVGYVRYNSTHLLNVNKVLLVQGYATIWNFDNEFDPYSWTLYVYYP